jgi:hypothetical protein
VKGSRVSVHNSSNDLSIRHPLVDEDRGWSPGHKQTLLVENLSPMRDHRQQQRREGKGVTLKNSERREVVNVITRAPT